MSQVIKIAPSASELTKPQKEFNRLIAKIEKTRNRVATLESAIEAASIKIAKNLAPVIEKHNNLRVELVMVLDRFFTREKTKKTEQKKIKNLIVRLTLDLIGNGRVELKEIYDRYSDSSFDEMNDEAEAATAEMAKTMFSAMYGIEFDPDADVSTPEKMFAYIEEKMNLEEQKQASKQAKKPEKPKTAKQIEREEAKAVREKAKADAEKKITQSVRDVYMDLVKTFHPDREQDETEKIRKTAILQRVTEAYDNNDLLALLMLQMELERIDQSHLENLPEDRLKIFNKVLRTQADELSMALSDVCTQISSMCRRPFYDDSPEQLIDYMLNKDIKEMKQAVKELQKDLENFQSAESIRRFIKEYQIPDEDYSDFFLG